MAGPQKLKSFFPRDPNMRELIDSLWRDIPALYTEKYKGASNRLPSTFSPDIDFGQALGQDHVIGGNLSSAWGLGGKTSSFREQLIGSYPAEIAGNPLEWVATDRLFALGNGIDADNRHDALRIYKSGYTQLNNSLRIGAYEHGAVLPEAGALQYTTIDGFQAYKNAQWNKIAFLNSDVADTKLTYYDALTGNLKTSAIAKATLEFHLADVAGYTAKSVSTGTGQILSSFTSDAKGHVTGISLRSLVESDIPYLSISKVTGLQGALDGKSPVHSHPYLSDSDSRIANWSTAYSWGNHAGLYAPASGSDNYIQNQYSAAQLANIWVIGEIKGARLHTGSTTNAGYWQARTGDTAKFVIGSDSQILGGSDDDLSLYSYLGRIKFHGTSFDFDNKATFNGLVTINENLRFGINQSGIWFSDSGFSSGIYRDGDVVKYNSSGYHSFLSPVTATQLTIKNTGESSIAINSITDAPVLRFYKDDVLKWGIVGEYPSSGQLTFYDHSVGESRLALHSSGVYVIGTLSANKLQVTDNTLVTNLNADLLDGYHSNVSNVGDTIALRDSNGNITSTGYYVAGSGWVYSPANANQTSIDWAANRITMGSDINGIDITTETSYRVIKANGYNLQIRSGDGNHNLLLGYEGGLKYDGLNVWYGGNFNPAAIPAQSATTLVTNLNSQYFANKSLIDFMQKAPNYQSLNISQTDPTPYFGWTNTDNPHGYGYTNYITFGSGDFLYKGQIAINYTGNGLSYRSIEDGNSNPWYKVWDSGNLVNPITGTLAPSYIPVATGTGSLGNSRISQLGFVKIDNPQDEGNAATSGTTQTYGTLRLKTTVSDGVLDTGYAGGGTWWIQSTDARDLSQTYKLKLNPKGGTVEIGGDLMLGSAKKICLRDSDPNASYLTFNPYLNLGEIKTKLYGYYGVKLESPNGYLSLDTAGNLIASPLVGSGTRIATASATGQLGSLSYTDFISNNGIVTGTPWTSMGYLTSTSLSGYATQSWVSSNYDYYGGWIPYVNGASTGVYVGSLNSYNFIAGSGISLSASGLNLTISNTLDLSGYSLTTHNHSGVYQPLDADLTAIAALSATSGLLKKTAADTWTLDTTAYVSGTPWTAMGYITSSALNGYVQTTDSRLSDARPASDVYAWAKASTKPTYSWTEIESRPQLLSSFTNDPGYITSVALSGYSLTTHLHNGVYAFVDHNHSGLYAPASTVSFPGFGTSHSLAAYGDHSHDYSSLFAAKANEGKSYLSGYYANLNPNYFEISGTDIRTMMADGITLNNYLPVSSHRVYVALGFKQEVLESGTNIKTINNQSLLGSGNIDISGGGGISDAASDSNYYVRRNAAWVKTNATDTEFSASKINLPGGGYIQVEGGNIHIYPGSGQLVVHGQVTADSFYKN